MFEAEGPCAGKHMHPRFMRDKFPCMQLRLQGAQLGLNGFPSFLSMRTVDGLGVGGTVSCIHGRFGREDVRLNVSDSEGP